MTKLVALKLDFDPCAYRSDREPIILKKPLDDAGSGWATPVSSNVAATIFK
jgi:hypothetical protein